MTVGSVLTKTGFNAILSRAFTNTGTYTVPSQFKIGTGTTTPSTTDTDLATPITAWSGGTDYKNYTVSYPSLDTVNQKVTLQGFIASTEANGNTITEYGDFNTDGTPVMFTRTVFTAITKTSAVQAFITTRLKRV
jgi:hypothetical protein